MVFRLLVDVTSISVDVTDDEDTNSLLDNMLVGITDIVVVEVCSLVDISLVDTADASSVFDTDLVNVTSGKEVCLLLETRLAKEVNVVEVFSLLDTPMEVTDITVDSILPDNVLVDVTDGDEFSSLFNVPLVKVTG